MQSVAVSDTFQTASQRVSRKVRELRKGVGMSQEVFADACGIDRTYASQIERAIANPSLSVLCRIADVLQIELSELLK